MRLSFSLWDIITCRLYSFTRTLTDHFTWHVSIWLLVVCSLQYPLSAFRAFEFLVFSLHWSDCSTGSAKQVSKRWRAMVIIWMERRLLRQTQKSSLDLEPGRLKRMSVEAHEQEKTVLARWASQSTLESYLVWVTAGRWCPPHGAESLQKAALR